LDVVETAVMEMVTVMEPLLETEMAMVMQALLSLSLSINGSS
jgi:hypothetical protein